MGLAVGGGFSLSGAMLDLFKQAAIGVLAGAVLGYLAVLLIAHERWAVLAEYASEVTLAFIGAYFATSGLQASVFMAVLVFGIVAGLLLGSRAPGADPIASVTFVNPGADHGMAGP